MKIEVTPDDIAHGLMRSTSRCPIALAVQRTTGESALVYTTSVVLSPNGANRRRIWTKEIIDFIAAFDFGREVKPFSFELDIP